MSSCRHNVLLHHFLLMAFQVLEDCRNVVREMEEASGAGEKGRLQEALKEAVNWLSKNGSNPDVAANSAQVQCSLSCTRLFTLSILELKLSSKSSVPA